MQTRLAPLLLAALSAIAAGVRSDERGAFSSDAVPAGAYLVGFLHPRLDSLLVSAPIQRIDIPGSGGVQVKLFVRS